MAKPKSGGSGSVIISALDVEKMLREATGLPTSFFVTLEKAKVQQDGSMDAKYTYSTESAPPPPPTEKLTTGEPDGDV